MKTFEWMFIGLALLVMLSCRSNGGDKQDKPATLTDRDSGKVTKLAKGDALVVKLPGTAGTGYSWKVAKNKVEVLAPDGEPEVKSDARNEKLVGGPQSWVFKFKAAAAGTSELEIVYVRPWEKDKPPERTFKATVKVE